MRSDRNPPEGSVITMTESSEGFRYTWPAGRGTGLANIGMTAFLIFWLVGWAVGESFAINMLRSQETPGGVNLFMLAWLGGWTLGGIWCMWMVYLNLRPLQPATLLLGQGEIVYETGTRRPDLRVNDRRNTNLTAMMKGTRNRIHRIPVREATNLKLERIGERLRLSVDHDNQRIEVGEMLGEPDQEWLHGLLAGAIRES